jgi:hypothetical protein
LLIVGGGHASDTETLEAMCPAPAPPVCHDLRGGAHRFTFLHEPLAEEGSLGIQPFSKPSWYDQARDSTLPDMLELPIFHVQKNQFYV